MPLDSRWRGVGLRVSLHLDGPDFLARLATLGRDARLANAGDPVDFVVTLGSEAVARLDVADAHYQYV